MDYFICQGAQRFIRTKDICIICKMTSSGMFYAVTKVTDVNKEKNRTKNWALRNSCQDCLNCRNMVINWYKLLSIGQIRTEPVLCNASYPILLKFQNKYLMINHIKCFFKSTNTPAANSLSSSLVWMFSMMDIRALTAGIFNLKPNWWW